MDAPQISIFSVPMVSTWVFDETHRVLFDAGDGAAAMLDSRIHKARVVAITHAHRDHCSGLMQFLNLRGGAGDFRAVYPVGSGSARTLAGFLSTFDTRSTAHVQWETLNAGDTTPIEPPRHFLRGFATRHYPPPEPEKVRSLGYQIVRHVDRVKPEFRHLPQPELDALRRSHGREFITRTEEDILLSVTGDTTPLPASTFAGTRVLLHECTFLEIEELEELTDRGHPHSFLDAVLEIARDAEVEYLGLYHISNRYEHDVILNKVAARCRQMQLRCRVSVALPGVRYDDLFARCVWKGNRHEEANSDTSSERRTQHMERPDGAT
jgi:ribonuclease Z